MKNPKREKLKPCPFTGHQAQLLSDGPKHMPYRVNCIYCHASTTQYRLQNIAVAAWNRRT